MIITNKLYQIDDMHKVSKMLIWLVQKSYSQFKVGWWLGLGSTKLAKIYTWKTKFLILKKDFYMFLD